MITRYFNLYLNAGVSVAPVIHVNQYDRGEQWIFTLLHEDGTKFTPSSGAICGVKSDGHGILNSATIDSAGRVVVTETEQMTAAAGQAVFELSIDGQTHGTANFVVMVERKPTDQAEMSDSDYSYIEEQMDRAEAIEQRLGSLMPQNVGTPGQVLTRVTEGAKWDTFEPLPSGGTTGQVLTKTGTGADWEDIKALPDGGSAGQILYKTQSAEAWQDFPRVECTQAEYDAMATHDPNVVYYITDGSTSYPTAEDMRFDPTGTGLSATSVQGAIEEVDNSIVVQTPNKTVSFNVVTVAVTVTGTRLYAFIPFPFLTKNINYSVSFSNAGSVTNVGTPTISIIGQRTSGIIVYLDFPSGSLSNQCYFWNGAIVNVTFA